MSDPVDEHSGSGRPAASPPPVVPLAPPTGIPEARPRRRLESVPVEAGDDLADARDRHPSTALGRHVDRYLAAVARELEMLGVIAGPPQRSASPTHLSGSIVIDCVAVWSAADAPDPVRPDPVRPGPVRPGTTGGDADRGGYPLPVVVAWNEDHGWVAGLHLDGVVSSSRMIHPDLLPAPAEVAGFVVGLARSRPPGGDVPPPPGSGPSRLRLLR